MFNVKFMTKPGGVAETQVEATTEYAARKAVAARPDCDIIVSCEKAYASPCLGAKTSAAVAKAAEALRETLKGEYGADFALVVMGRGNVVAASNLTQGTVLARA